MSDLAGKALSHYRINGILGAGGMGVVYRAEDTNLSRMVALKFLPESLSKNPQALERFEREARAASAIGHPSICTIYEIGEHEGQPFIAMELVEGQTLAEKLKGGPMAVEEVVGIARQLAEGLEEAHEHNIIHRDLKPTNVMIAAKGRAKILDFGVAKVLRPEGPNTPTEEDLLQTEVGAMIGTVPYMAPEQLRGGPVDARTDLYAFGGLLYEMLTGHRAFQETQPAQLIAAILTRSPRPPRELNGQVSPGLETLILKALAKNPTERYQTARELSADLDPQGAASRTPMPSVSSTAPIHLRLTPILAGTGLAIAVLAGLLLLLIPALRLRLKSSKSVSQPGLPSQRQVAVLPFTVIGGNDGDDAFSRGLAEMLAAKLTQLSLGDSLQVVPASDVFAQHVTTAKDARKEFGVNLVIVGSMERAGDRIRIAYALVDPSFERQVTASSMTLAAADPFGIEDKVVEGAATMLGLNLSSGGHQALESHGTQVAIAFQDYLEGLGYLQNYERVENLNKAIESFRSALKVDPAYALAYSGLGQAYLHLYQQTKDSMWLDHAHESCDRAVTLDAKLPASHLCLGELESSTGQYANAIGEFQKVLEIEPTNSRAFSGLAYAESKLGKVVEAEQTYRRAISVEPNYWGPYLWLGNLSLRMGDYSKAAELYKKVIELAPENQIGYYNLGGVYYFQGRWTEAEEMFKKSTAVHPSANAYSNLGTVIFYQGHYAESARWFEKAAQLNPKDETILGNLADAYRWAPGEQGKAPATYAKAITMVEDELRVNPRSADGWSHLALYRAKTNQKREAIRAAQEASRFAPSDVAIDYYSAIVYHLAGDRPQSLRWLKRAVTKGYPLNEARADPEWNDWRNDPAFMQCIGSKKE